MNSLTKYSLAAAFAIGGTAAASAASAMLIAPVAPPAMIEHVAWGCGPGWHPNRWGRCVPNAPVYYGWGWRRPVYYGGWGWHHPHYYGGWHGPHRWYGHWHR